MDQKVKRINKLINDIAKGKIKSLDLLYSEYGGLMYIMARKYLYDKSQAEDLVSNILLKLVKTAAQFKDGENGLNWIFKSIHNAAININLKENRVLKTEEEQFTSLSDILYSEEKCDNNIMLADAINLLDDLEKFVIFKRFWEGLTLKEIAEILDKPLTTTQSIVKKALGKIKNTMEK